MGTCIFPIPKLKCLCFELGVEKVVIELFKSTVVLSWIIFAVWSLLLLRYEYECYCRVKGYVFFSFVYWIWREFDICFLVLVCFYEWLMIGLNWIESLCWYSQLWFLLMIWWEIWVLFLKFMFMYVIINNIIAIFSWL